MYIYSMHMRVKQKQAQVVISDFSPLRSVWITDVLRGHSDGYFQVIIKDALGYFDIVEYSGAPAQNAIKHPSNLLNLHKKNAVQAIFFKVEPNGTNYQVFQRNGKRINAIDRDLLADLSVETISKLYPTTDLYSPVQFNEVGAVNAADKAYVKNQK